MGVFESVEDKDFIGTPRTVLFVFGVYDPRPILRGSGLQGNSSTRRVPVEVGLHTSIRSITEFYCRCLQVRLQRMVCCAYNLSLKDS
jgi:hypothetical protein